MYHENLDVHNPTHEYLISKRLKAKLPTIAACASKYSTRQTFVYPLNKHFYAGNFLHSMFSVPVEEYVVDPVACRAVDRVFLFLADRQQTGSSGADPVACIAARIAFHGAFVRRCKRSDFENAGRNRFDRQQAKVHLKSKRRR